MRPGSPAAVADQRSCVKRAGRWETDWTYGLSSTIHVSSTTGPFRKVPRNGNATRAASATSGTNRRDAKPRRLEKVRMEEKKAPDSRGESGAPKLAIEVTAYSSG